MPAKRRTKECHDNVESEIVIALHDRNPGHCVVGSSDGVRALSEMVAQGVRLASLGSLHE